MKKLNFILLLSVIFPAIVGKAQFPSSYDLRNYGYVTSVKDQGSNCGSCWAFATCASIESAWLKQGGSAVDISEDNLIDCHDFDESPCAGGSFYMSQALLSRHEGPLLESTDGYTPSSQNCMSNSPFPPVPNSFVEDVRFLPAIKDSIKSAIMQYGAVASTMYFTISNYNSSTFTYYDPVIDANDLNNPHGVTIVGWDDNLMFSGTSNTGGWIIKDSYGTSWANNGYFYCSYDDAGILSENAIFPVRYDVPGSPNSPHVYLHDELGWVDNYGYSSNVGYALVKYTINPSSGFISPQRIKRIGTYAVEPNTTIEIDLFHTKSGNTLSDHFGSASISCPYKGFYTVPLSLPVDTLGTEVYIKVKYICPSGTQNPIPIEKVEANHTTNNFSASSQSCWMSPLGNTWTLIGSGTNFNMDACVKMYTQDDQTSSLANVNANEFKIYPNPAPGIVKISLAKDQNYDEVHLYDGMGRKLYTQVLSNHKSTLELDLTALPGGVYSVVITGGHKPIVRKLVLENQ